TRTGATHSQNRSWRRKFFRGTSPSRRMRSESPFPAPAGWRYNMPDTPRCTYMAISRRHFFYGSLLAGAVPVGGFGSTPSLKMMGYKSPNEKLNIASIGAGGKASSDIRGCAQTENIVALCDVDDTSAAGIYKQFDKQPKY